MSAENVSSVVFARYTSSEPLPVAKIGSVVNHVHDLGFAQQIASRVLQRGEIVNKHIYQCGYRDVSGNQLGLAIPTVAAGTTALVTLTHTAAEYGAVDLSSVWTGQVGVGPVVQANQISWASAAADISGVFQGRHTLKMDSFLNTWYGQQSFIVNPSTSNLDKAKLIDRHNQTEAGPVGWFGVDDGTVSSVQRKWAQDATTGVAFEVGDKAAEAMGVVLTPLTSSLRQTVGFNAQTQVITNILSDLGVDVASEEETARGAAADKLDSVSFLRLSNYLSKHNTLKAVVEDAAVASGESMTRNQLFVELAKQFDINNKIHETSKSARAKAIAANSKIAGPGSSLTKNVQKEIAKGTTGTTSAQKYLEAAFCDITQFESGRCAISFLYKSQTQGVRDTEVRVHMKLSGGLVAKTSNTDYPFALEGPGAYHLAENTYYFNGTEAVATSTMPALEASAGLHLKAGDVIGRTFEQMCTVHPLMVDGKPHGVFY
jgi:hypothetical protein